MTPARTRASAILALLVMLCWPGPTLAGEAARLADDPFPPADAADVGVDPGTLHRLAALVAGFVEEEDVVGAELLVVRNRRSVLHAAFGWRDLPDQRPMETDTIFNIRSMAKPLLGSATQRLAADGRLALDDPVAQYLPSFDHGRSRAITIEHLLTHRSGFPDETPPGPPHSYADLRDVADYWGRRGPTMDPGARFRYSDPGVDVLGAVLEQAAGQPLAEVVDEEVFRPLGMVDAFALTSADHPARYRMSSNHVLGEDGRWQRYWKPGDEPLAPFVLGSGTTWYATPKDYARLLAAWMDDGQVGEPRWLPAASVHGALTPVSPMPYANAIPDLRVAYGQLWQVYLDADERVVAFGHSGSDGTYAWAWPEDDLMVLYFTQSRGQRTRLSLEPLFDELLAAPDGR